ncbi:Putative DNA-directed RNA polymerase delta subunit [Alteracholeplasma palmae J233]|uniref:RNAP delta factor n=1 Tax=Alteracholeplasma palmae (strain ATCC 49389 / J233) TaxID=1318466 RepID=U4KSG4_ALTPJ|nr:DNA-directed RNA polymerase subunit delta [Alteracholeplasma palmae]CCV64986.1 Putative DNA-directed RNA polymerase delta subunit [Alteracholeplasma palmae J233]
MNKEKLSELSLLDIVEEILKEKNEPTPIYTLMDEAATIKGIDPNDVDEISQLYLDITLSAKFVFYGENLWALKEGHLDLWDKESFSFDQDLADEEIEDEELIDFTEFNLEEVAEDIDEDEELEIDEDSKEEKEYIEVELPIESIDEDNDDDVEIEFDDTNYDEDDYNEIMDDYEDMYDE